MEDPSGPEVIKPVGWSGMGPELFLGIGPEDVVCLELNGPDVDPDRSDPLVDGRDDFKEGGCGPGPSRIWISNIFPSSPDFLTSPPVYGTAREPIVGCLSFCN